MNKQLSDALQVCLESLEHGGTLDSALSRYPRLAADLRPLLESAYAARTLRPDSGQAESLAAVPRNTRTRGRSRVLAAAVRLRSSKISPWRMGFAQQVSFATLVVVIFVLLSGNGLLTASARSLPGDVLYPLKLTIENAQLQLTTSPDKHQQLQEEFKQRRLQETETLITAGRVEVVEFDGKVTAETADGWIIADIPVIVTSQTSISGVIVIGAEVEVTGQTETDGRVRATSMAVKDESESDEDPEHPSPGATGTSQQEGPNQNQEETEMPEPTDNHDEPGSDQTPEPTQSPGSDEDDVNSTPQPNESPDQPAPATPTP
jgi:hypothetical protein